MKRLFLLIMVILCCFSCSKKDDSPSPQPEPGGGGQQYGVPGALLFDWATDGILKIDLKTGKRSTVLPSDASRNGWDVSRDGKKILLSTDDPNDFDANIYTYADIETGTIVSQFTYYPSEGDFTHGFISHDETMIAVKPTFDDGIVILNMQGKVLHHLTGFAGRDFGYDTEIAWMPDNSLLFTLGNGIYRTNAAFTQASLLRKLNFQNWGDISVSPDGRKIAFYGGNHIWMMNGDGDNLVQVTESDEIEKVSEFSPDGEYLLVGTNWHTTGPFGSIWYLTIIPADGEKYNVNVGEDPRVVFIRDTEGATGGQACGGYMYWR